MILLKFAIGHMALVKASHTPSHFFQIPHDILVEEVTEDTVSGRELVSVYSAYHSYGRRVFTDFRGKNLIQCQNYKDHFLPSRREHLCLPLRDFPLAYLSGESERQLAEFTSEEIQTSNLNEFVDSVKDSGIANSHCTTTDLSWRG